MNASPHILQKVARATVGVHARIPPSHVSNAIGLGTDRRGTGTLIDADGMILTVYYILIGARSVTVTLNGGDQCEARILARDYAAGLGLLKIEGSRHPHIEVASSADCTVGQEVFTVASAGGAARCADTGVITYLGPFDAVWEFALDRCVCMTASSLNIGLSGGPICDSGARMIGISYLNFADLGRAIMGVPGECYLALRDRMLRDGERLGSPAHAWLGVLSYTLREHVVIASVMPGGPGDKAGLRQGDLVLNVDGQEISERRALYDALTCRRAGDRVQLRVLRDSQVRDIVVPTIRVEDYFG